jgi:hypothetical protein
MHDIGELFKVGSTEGKTFSEVLKGQSGNKRVTSWRLFHLWLQSMVRSSGLIGNDLKPNNIGTNELRIEDLVDLIRENSGRVPEAELTSVFTVFDPGRVRSVTSLGKKQTGSGTLFDWMLELYKQQLPEKNRERYLAVSSPEIAFTYATMSQATVGRSSFVSQIIDSLQKNNLKRHIFGRFLTSLVHALATQRGELYKVVGDDKFWARVLEPEYMERVTKLLNEKYGKEGRRIIGLRVRGPKPWKLRETSERLASRIHRVQERSFAEDVTHCSERCSECCSSTATTQNLGATLVWRTSFSMC